MVGGWEKWRVKGWPVGSTLWREAEETGSQQGDGCPGPVGSAEGSEWRQGVGPEGARALHSHSQEPFLK